MIYIDVMDINNWTREQVVECVHRWNARTRRHSEQFKCISGRMLVRMDRRDFANMDIDPTVCDDLCKMVEFLQRMDSLQQTGII